MTKWLSGKKRGLINLLCIAVLVTVVAVGALVPVMATDICIVYDDHGNCLLWESDYLERIRNAYNSVQNQ